MLETLNRTDLKASYNHGEADFETMVLLLRRNCSLQDYSENPHQNIQRRPRSTQHRGLQITLPIPQHSEPVSSAPPQSSRYAMAPYEQPRNLHSYFGTSEAVYASPATRYTTRKTHPKIRLTKADRAYRSSQPYPQYGSGPRLEEHHPFLSPSAAYSMPAPRNSNPPVLTPLHQLFQHGESLRDPFHPPPPPQPAFRYNEETHHANAMDLDED